MKLDYKKTILVGFAFFVISAFWQAYEAIVPLILTNHFGMTQDISGIVMAIDNIIAVFMLPLFGSLSDKIFTPHGKRTPFIFFGTIAAIVSFIALMLVDSLQYSKLGDVITDTMTIDEKIAAAATVMSENPWIIILFIVVLLFALVSMATFRSPAVALMPDVTIKPLRSKANAIINLMGTAGGIIVLLLGILFGTKNPYMNYLPYIIAVCGLMAIGLAVFLFTVKENKWADEMKKVSEELNIDETPVEESGEKRKLTKPELTSLILILISVALWYFGYNAITSKYSVYATNILHFDYASTLLIAQAAAIVSFIPVGMLASKIGRRRSILIGVALLTTAFVSASFITEFTPPVFMTIVFIVAGIGWATINVNSFPMVVELAKGGDVGKYTGYYYTASMAAQGITPYLSGLLIEIFGWPIFFPYAAVFVSLAFVTMFFVKHGDSIPEKTGALESLGGADD